MGGKNVMLDCGMHMGFNDEVGDLLGLAIWIRGREPGGAGGGLSPPTFR